MPWSACTPAMATATPSCGLPKRWQVTGGRNRSSWRARAGTVGDETGNKDIKMDFSLNEEQRAWQMKARKFAQEEIRPISLERDLISDPRETWDWEIIEKGSKLG